MGAAGIRAEQFYGRTTANEKLLFHTPHGTPTCRRSPRGNVTAPQTIGPTLEAGLMRAKRLEKPDKINRYAARFLRRNRTVLAPKGSSSNAPTIIVVGSGTAVKF